MLANQLGWESFFLMTTVVTLPALALLLWMMAHLPRPEPAPADG
jgi:predicted MFS family arabinose efflux permease